MADVLEQALAHHQGGRHDTAEALYAGILAATPREPTALYLGGLLAIAMGRMEAATARLSTLAEVAPTHVASLMALANLHAISGDAPAAIVTFRRVLARDPAHLEARLGLAEALLAHGDAAAALPLARQAAASSPGSRALTALSRALLGCDRPAEALEAADTIPDGSAELWLARGACLTRLDRPGEAETALRRSIELAPTYPSAWLRLGTLCASRDALAEAEAALHRAIACDPSCGEAQASLGAVLLRAGRPDAAEAALREALARDPDLVAAHQNLAAILAAGRRHRAAQTHRAAAYRTRNLFVEPGPGHAPRILLLTTGGGGNVPTQFLLPRSRFTRLSWIIDHASPDQPGSLPPYDLAFNAIGDPDAADAVQAPLSGFAGTCGRALLNHPDRIAATRRDRLPALLAGIDGVVVPAVRRLPPETRLDQAGLAMPVLLRPAGTHGGLGTMLIRDPAQLAGVAVAGPEPCYATEFHDARSPDGLFRKIRVIFVNGVPWFYHLAIGADWLVHYDTAGMDVDAGRRAEEAAFLADPAAVLGPRAMAAVAAIGERLGLAFAGLDFASLPDGRILVFEANATMLVHPEDPDGPFAYKASHIDAILEAFDGTVARSLS